MVGRVARLLAPIAIIAVAVAIYLIVHATVDKHHHTVSHHHHSAHASGRHHHKHHHPAPKFYVVKPGDTLSAIAVRTHISLTRLQALNPNVSANTLQTGQRLRLRR
jgi:Tfp pilus assembly protein FimV